MSLLFVFYAAILLRGLVITWRAQSSFARLLAGALITTFFFGLVVNLGMVSGLLPVVGVPPNGELRWNNHGLYDGGLRC